MKINQNKLLINPKINLVSTFRYYIRGLGSGKRSIDLSNQSISSSQVSGESLGDQKLSKAVV